MATTYYVDLENGNDANTGLSFAQRKKTITGVSTASAGDTIRVMGSQSPTVLGSVSWNTQSNVITLPSGLTAMINTCDTAWTASANVTATTSTNRKEGAFSASLAIAAGFTTGIVAYQTIPSTDYSAYQQISFWIRFNVNTVSATAFELRLCSDTVGAVPVDIAPIPGISTGAANGKWISVTYDKGAALGSAIQSISLAANSDPGTVTVLLDNIIACKASSAADSITLNSLISKNTGGATWYSIKSIIGDTAQIDANTNSLANAGRGYEGTTETVTTYKFEPIMPASTIIISTTPLTPVVSGAVTLPITISGGWNRTDMSTQVGETWVSGQACALTAIQMSGINYVTWSKFGIVRYNTGIANTGTSIGMALEDFSSNCNDVSLSLSVNTYFNSFTNFMSSNCDNTSSPSFRGVNSTMTNVTFQNHTVNGPTLTATKSQINGLSLINNGGEGMIVSSTCNTVIYDLVAYYNASISIVNEGNDLVIIRSSFGDSIDVLSNVNQSNFTIRSQDHNLVANSNIVYTDGGVTQSDITNRHTASGLAWSLEPTSINRYSGNPLILSGIKIACVASNLVTVSIWGKRTSSTITGRLVVPGGQIAGVPSDVVATISLINTYEQISLSFTPAEDGVVDVQMQAFGGTTDIVYFDDLSITQV